MVFYNDSSFVIWDENQLLYKKKKIYFIIDVAYVWMIMLDYCKCIHWQKRSFFGLNYHREGNCKEVENLILKLTSNFTCDSEIIVMWIIFLFSVIIYF